MTGSFTQGTVAGIVATVPMTIAMASVRKGLAGKHAVLPFEQVATRIAEKTEIADKLDNDEQDVFNWVSHFGFGAATGALYGLITPKPNVHAVGKGIAYGMAVWATSYVGALPAANIMRFPTKEPKNKIASEVISHVVWGVALGLAYKALHGKSQADSNA